MKSASFLILFFFIGHQSIAQAVQVASIVASREPMTVEESTVHFISVPEWRWTLSESCLNLKKLKPNAALKVEQFACDAAKALRTPMNHEIQITGGQNPGAMICKALKAKVVYALRKGSQMTVCRFADGSMVSSGSLTAAHFNSKSTVQ